MLRSSAVVTNIHSGQHDLLEPRCDKAACLRDACLNGLAPARAPCPRDGAEAALIVAPILHLEVTPVFVSPGRSDMAGPNDSVVPDIRHIDCGDRTTSPARDDNRRGENFSLRPQHNIDPVDRGNLFWLELGVAAGDDAQRRPSRCAMPAG